MMWDCQQLIGLTVSALDGEIGELTDLCFDDERWVIRYFVVHSASRDRQMLIAPGIDELADDLAGHRPRGRAAGDPTEGLDWGTVLADPDATAVPTAVKAGTIDAHGQPGPWRPTGEGDRPSAVETHLRRVEEVRGYRVVATDGQVGRVDGFLISEASWAIEYVIVETERAARKVVLLPVWIRSIDRAGGCVALDVPGDVVLAGPEFTEDIEAAYESWLVNHLGTMMLPQMH